MNSEEHRKNILNGKFTEAALSMGYNGSSNRYYFCMLFATPQSK